MKKKKVLFSLLAITFTGSVFIMASSQINKQIFTPKNKQSTPSNSSAVGSENQKGGNSLNLTWNELGPDNMGGRTRAILVDKNNANTIYAGGVSGGLWKSTTGGSSWVKINDFAENLGISCIAQGADGAIYAGTGEGLSTSTGNANGSTGFVGKGIYKSTDGSTFTLLTSTIPATENTNNIAWAYVNKIACDPNNANRIYASTNKGLQSSDDGGSSWINPVGVTGVSTDVDVATDGTVITSVNNLCYVSSNGNDNSFVCQSVSGTNGDLPATGVSRIEFAFAPSNPEYVYASVADSTDNSLYNIYKSTNKGDNWSVIGPGGSGMFQPFGKKGNSNNTIAVHPTNPDKIFVGGDNLWLLKDELSTWTQKSLNYLESESNYYIHAGINTIVFSPTNPNIFYIGNNGGISRSLDGGETFETININYSTIQCNNVTASPYGWMMMVGTDDNGTILIPNQGAFPKHAYGLTSTTGGSGGMSIFSYINPEAFFTSSIYGITQRSPDAGSNFYPSTFNQDASNLFYDKKMLPTGYTAGQPSFFAAYYAPIILWECGNDTYSKDSIEFTPAKIANEKFEDKGDGQTKHFTGTLEKGKQPFASIVPGTIQIVSGSIHANDDGSGNIIGSVDNTVSSTISYSDGSYDITFSSAPASSGNILISYETRFNANSYLYIESGNKPAAFWYETLTSIEQGDTIYIQDIIQSKFFVGFDNAIWMTKQALDFANNPKWFKVANIPQTSNHNTQCMALSKDGNYLFVGTADGKLYRLSNLRAAQNATTAECDDTTNCVIGFKELTITTNNKAITSISCDPSNPDNILITLGNYNTTTPYILYSSNALDSDPTFVSKQGNLPYMPVYSSLMPIFESGAVIIGTEHGIYSLDDISASSPQWVEENTGLANVPVYSLWQQQYDYSNVTNYGTIYAGTHGRGVYECTKYTSINDPQTQNNSVSSSALSLSVYPNPVINNAALTYTIPENSDIKIKVLDVTGKMLYSANLSKISKGSHVFNIDCSILKNGTYFIHMQTGSDKAITKFVKIQ